MAISTTGDQHRLGFLETAARNWWRALAAFDLPTTVFVTVDGTEDDAEQVLARVAGFAEVYRVGQTLENAAGSREGVAVNKNTGIELLMDAGVEHLFLSDDDTWPLRSLALSSHIDMDVAHSMVCWGDRRLEGRPETVSGRVATWNWPRGVMLYQTRDVIEHVGGMDEAFGKGGHEHVEWSRRIHNAGLTPHPFISPASYALHRAQGARWWWNCEDMPRQGEPAGSHRSRRRVLTTIKRTDADREQMAQVLASHEGDASFVPYRAHENSRTSATLCPNTTSRGADT